MCGEMWAPEPNLTEDELKISELEDELEAKDEMLRDIVDAFILHPIMDHLHDAYLDDALVDRLQSLHPQCVAYVLDIIKDDVIGDDGPDASYCPGMTPYPGDYVYYGEKSYWRDRWRIAYDRISARLGC